MFLAVTKKKKKKNSGNDLRTAVKTTENIWMSDLPAMFLFVWLGSENGDLKRPEQKQCRQSAWHHQSTSLSHRGPSYCQPITDLHGCFGLECVSKTNLYKQRVHCSKYLQHISNRGKKNKKWHLFLQRWVRIIKLCLHLYMNGLAVWWKTKKLLIQAPETQKAIFIYSFWANKWLLYTINYSVKGKGSFTVFTMLVSDRSLSKQ